MSYYPNIFGPFEPNFNRLNNNIPPRYIPTHHRFEALSNPGSFTSIPTASFFRDSDVHDQWNDARVIPIIKEADRNTPSGYVDIPIEFSRNEHLRSPRHSPRKHNRSPEHRTPKSPIISQRSFSSDRSPPNHFNKGLSPTRNKPKFGQVREIPIITTTQASNFSDKRSVQTRSPNKCIPEETEHQTSSNILEDYAHTTGNVISNPEKTDIPIVREQSKKSNDKNKTQTKHHTKNQRQKSTSPNRGNNMKENQDIKNMPTGDKNKINDVNQAETIMEDEKSEAPPPSPPKPSPQEIVEEINNRLATEIEPALESFQGDKCCKEYLYLDEALTKCLLTLDGIDSGGDPNIRQMRRDAVHKVNDYVSKLEGKVQLTASTKKTDDKMETKPNDKSEAKKDQNKDENTEMEET